MSGDQCDPGSLLLDISRGLNLNAGLRVAGLGVEVVKTAGSEKCRGSRGALRFQLGSRSTPGLEAVVMDGATVAPM